MKKIIISYFKFRIQRIRKSEFSKKLTIFAAILMVVAFSFSVILAFCEKDPIETITGTIVTVCGGEMISYYIKSAAEKNSRNKYGIDSDGIPFANKTQEQSGKEEGVNG